MDDNPNRAEAERLLGLAEKLLQSKDLTGAKEFAVLAQDTYPLLDGSDQVLAITDVLISSENSSTRCKDWYAILQAESRCGDLDLIRKQYRRLALLLHPDKNKYTFADKAFNLVTDAWAVLSDSSKKAKYDSENCVFSKVELSNPVKLQVRRETNSNLNTQEHLQRQKLSSFWTACPYCYMMYEYPRIYENCCLMCHKCERAFHAAMIPSLPPLVPGKDEYYCCWGFFPIKFVLGASETGEEEPKVDSTPKNDSRSQYQELGAMHSAPVSQRGRGRRRRTKK